MICVDFIGPKGEAGDVGAVGLPGLAGIIGDSGMYHEFIDLFFYKFQSFLYILGLPVSA